MQHLLRPGDTVQVGQTDQMGMTGRDPHPTPACDFQIAYVVEYRGWNSPKEFWMKTDEGWAQPDAWTDNIVPDLTDEIVFNAPLLKPFDHPDDGLKTHFYRCVVPGQGVFDFCDYEFEGAE